jgi:hypothetical protein
LHIRRLYETEEGDTEVRQERYRDRQAVTGFTDEERVAMKERAQELKAEARRGPRAKKADG